MTADLIGKLIADKYRIESLISESDSGDLFHAVHELRGYPVTLEILPAALAMDKRWAAKFLDRARAASSLSHDNVLAINDLGEDSKGYVYAAYDAIDGQPLADLIRKGRLDQPLTLKVAAGTAAALTASHAKGLVHGRLDPNSIFVSPAGDVKVIGFGGDKLSVPRDADPRYLSPEQCTDFPIADNRSDVYALAAVIYEMLTGATPHSGETRAEIFSKLGEAPRPFSEFRDDLHPQIEPIVLTALARDPDLRYQTAAAFAEDLDRVAREIGVPVAKGAAAGSKHNAWKTAAIAMAGVIVLAGALIYATSVRSTDPTATLVADADALPVQPINPATGAQEEALLKNGPLGDASVMTDPYLVGGQLPGGDGYNAWANGAVPPAGAPLGQTTGPLAGSQYPQAGPLPPQAIAPPGQTVTVNPNGGSVFMPNESGVILVPVPQTEPDQPVTKPQPANTAVKPGTTAAPTPKPLATPPPKATDKPAADAKTAPAKPAAAPAKKKTEED